MAAEACATRSIMLGQAGLVPGLGILDTNNLGPGRATYNALLDCHNLTLYVSELPGAITRRLQRQICFVFSMFPNK